LKAGNDCSLKSSEPVMVDNFIAGLNHPLVEVIKALRTIILLADKEVGEEIKWNAPAFFYTGPLMPFNPKEYKRHIAVFNFFKRDCIRVIFPSGAALNDTSGLLEGDYADGRRLALFHNMKEVTARKKDLQQIIQKRVRLIKK